MTGSSFICTHSTANIYSLDTIGYTIYSLSLVLSAGFLMAGFPKEVPLVPLFGFRPSTLSFIFSTSSVRRLSLVGIIGKIPTMASSPTLTDGKFSRSMDSIPRLSSVQHSPSDHMLTFPSRPTGRLAYLPSTAPHCSLHPVRGPSYVSQSPVAIQDPDLLLDSVLAPQSIPSKIPNSPRADRETNPTIDPHEQWQAHPQ